MGRVLTLEELGAVRAGLKRRGLALSFANGHFDLLHVGHVRYLEAAAQLGDRLVVALNADDSVKRLKGPGRPLVPAAERAEIIAALECVDYVVVFDGASPRELLRQLEPEFHCKGTDYGSPSRVPEYTVVRAYGGETILVGDPKDHSTRDLISRAQALPSRASR